MTGITGSLSSESVAGFAPDYPTSDAPNKSKPIVMRNGNIQAHQRMGEHDLKEEDWNNYLDFADKQRSIR